MSEPIVEPPADGGTAQQPPAPQAEPPAPAPTAGPGDLGWLGYPGDESLADGGKDFDD